MQAANIRSKGALNQYFYPVGRDLMKAGFLPVRKVGADRDLGSGTGSMVEALQIKDGQSAPALYVF